MKQYHSQKRLDAVLLDTTKERSEVELRHHKHRTLSNSHVVRLATSQGTGNLPTPQKSWKNTCKGRDQELNTRCQNKCHTHDNDTTIDVFPKMSANPKTRKEKTSSYGIAAVLLSVSHRIKKAIEPGFTVQRNAPCSKPPVFRGNGGIVHPVHPRHLQDIRDDRIVRDRNRLRNGSTPRNAGSTIPHTLGFPVVPDDEL